MGYLILHDAEQDRAVLYDTTRERPIDCESFVGSDARDQAEDFLDWLGVDPRPSPGRSYRGYSALERARRAWHQLAYDGDGEFVGWKAPGDRKLAEALLAAEEAGDAEALILAENAILERLEIPLDETEQGLTQRASDRIDDFCRSQGLPVRAR